MSTDASSASSTGGAHQVVRFTVGAAGLCMELDRIRGILRADQIRYRPDGGASLGFVTGYETGVPVSSLAVRFGLCAPEEAPLGPVLVVESSRGLEGLMVDRVIGVRTARPDEIRPVPSVAGEAASALFKGVVASGDDLSLYLATEDGAPATPDAPSAARPPYAAPRSRSAPRGAGETSGASGTIVSFHAGAELAFALSITQVAEVLESPSLTPIPASPPDVLGLAAWRGVPVAVVDLGARVGRRPPLGRAPARLVIARTAGAERFVGLAVDGEIKMRGLPLRHRPFSGEAELEASLARGVFECDGALLVVPNLDRIARAGAPSRRSLSGETL